MRRLCLAISISILFPLSCPAEEQPNQHETKRAPRPHESLATRLVANDRPANDQPLLPRVGGEATQVLAELYAYDPAIPLEARVVEKKPLDDIDREKIVLRTTQGFLAPGYLQLPPGAQTPSPCVLLLHGWSGSKESWYEDDNYISGGNVRKGLLEKGHAVFSLDAQCHGDRIAENDYAPVNHYADESQPVDQRRKGYFTQREIYVQTVVDYRRVLDYLQTRPEIDADRMGVLGYSMGGTQAILLTAVEPRIQAAVACATPADPEKFSLLAPQNYVRALGDRPLFLVAGDNDPMCTVAQSKALFALLDSPAKQLRFYGGNHRLTADFVPDAVDWLFHHLQ